MSKMQIEILWPEHRFVDPEQLIVWANDDIADDAHDGPPATTLKQAMDILLETGSVTFREPVVY